MEPMYNYYTFHAFQKTDNLEVTFLKKIVNEC